MKRLVDDSTLQELMAHMSEAITRVRLLSDGIAKEVAFHLDYVLKTLDKLSNTTAPPDPVPVARVRAETRPYVLPRRDPALSGDASTKRVDGEH